MSLDKVYEPRKIEPRWAEWWIENGVFTAASDSAARVYALVMPPPNVTGSLHMGHMFELAETDITRERFTMDPGLSRACCGPGSRIQADASRRKSSRHALSSGSSAGRDMKKRLQEAPCVVHRANN